MNWAKPNAVYKVSLRKRHSSCCGTQDLGRAAAAQADAAMLCAKYPMAGGWGCWEEGILKRHAQLVLGEGET